MKYVSLLVFALLAAPAAHAIDASACQRFVQQLTLPGPWTRTVKNGVTSFRNQARVEVVTTAVYRLTQVFDDAGRLEVMQRAVANDLAMERQWAGPQLAVSRVRRARHGNLQQLCYAGIDRATQRRFVSVTHTSPELFQRLYYEAVGLSASRFNERATAILSVTQNPARAHWHTGLIQDANRSIPLPSSAERLIRRPLR